MPQPPAFDPLALPESNASMYPNPFRADNAKRFNRRLGQAAGLNNFGVTITRIVPGGQSAHRHAHTKQDEFVYVLEGEVVLNSNAGEQTLTAGLCAGFPAGTGDAHQFLNRSNNDVLLLVVGDRSAGDEVAYPDIDMALKHDAGGSLRFFYKDGTAY